MPEIGNEAKHHRLYKQVEMLEMNLQHFNLFENKLVFSCFKKDSFMLDVLFEFFLSLLKIILV